MYAIFNPMFLYYLHYCQLYSVTMAIYHIFFGVPFRAGRYWVDRSGSGQGQVARTGECGNEPSVSVKGWEISCLPEDMLAPQKGLFTVYFSCVFLLNFFRSDLLQELQVCWVWRLFLLRDIGGSLGHATHNSGTFAQFPLIILKTKSKGKLSASMKCVTYLRELLAERLSVIPGRRGLPKSSAVAYAISRRLLPPYGRVSSRVYPFRIYGGQSGTGQGFIRSVSCFSCQYYSTSSASLFMQIIDLMLSYN